MDSREAKTPAYMVYCVVVSCLGSFANGWVIGSPNLPGEITHACPTGLQHNANPSFPDCIPMETSLWGFAVASFCVGGLFGGVFGGIIQTKLGRKKTIIVNTAGWILGAIFIGLSVNVAMFIIGRILCGISCGLGSLATPTYIGEISSIRARGAMGSLNQFFIVTGILLSSVVGLPTSHVPYWRINFAICGIPAIVQAFLMSTCVESPRWLVSTKRIEEAYASLQHLRGSGANIQNEFYEIVEGQLGSADARHIMSKLPKPRMQPEHPDQEIGQTVKPISDPEKPADADDATVTIDPDEATLSAEIQDKEPHEAMTLIQVFTSPTIRRMTLIVLVHHAIQQLSGMNAVMYYSTTIFRSAFDNQMAQYMAIATTGINFVVTMAAVLLIDRMGRRPLLMIAEMGACIFSFTLVIGYRFNLPSLLVVSVFLYVSSFAIGIGPIPWMITSELTPTYANSSVGAAATGVNWAMNFLVGQLFPVIFEAIRGYSFVIFGVICFLAFIFTYFMLPETKNRSIENIVHDLESKTNRNHDTE